MLYQLSYTHHVRRAVEHALAVHPGDILVFLSGEKEIREVADLLRKVAAQPVQGPWPPHQEPQRDLARRCAVARGEGPQPLDRDRECGDALVVLDQCSAPLAHALG